MSTNKSFVSALSSIRPSSTFLTLHKYRNNSGEIADYSIVFNMSYKNSLERSINILESYIPESDIEIVAKSELLTSFKKSLGNIKDEPDVNDAYTVFKDESGNVIKGLKLHKNTNAIHLFGLIAHKKVYMPVVRDEVKHHPLTEAKSKLRDMCPISRFRQFKIVASQVDSITVQHKNLLPPDQN